MKKLTFNLNLIYILTILFGVLSAQGMERIFPDNPYELSRPRNTRMFGGYSYEDLLRLMRVEDDGPVKELTNNIKNFMSLRIICESGNRLFTPEKIGSLCKSYPQEVKNKVLKNLIEKDRYNFKSKRLPILILICAGASVTIKIDEKYLLEEAILHNDIPFVETLFKYHLYQDLTDDTRFRKKPSFFLASTVEMAKVFIKNKVNIHATSPTLKNNILWELVNGQYSSELMEFYFARGVDVKGLRLCDNACLLHRIAWFSFNCLNRSLSIKGLSSFDDADSVWFNADTSDNFFRKVELLLDVIPDMINELNCEDETPLDVAHRSLRNAQSYNIKAAVVLIDKLVSLFRKQGAFTAQELRRQKEHFSCINQI